MQKVRENDDSLLGSEELMRTIDEQIAANSLASVVAVDAANLRPQTTSLIARIEEAFKSWREIRDEPNAQAYLISLLGNPRS